MRLLTAPYHFSYLLLARVDSVSYDWASAERVRLFAERRASPGTGLLQRSAIDCPSRSGGNDAPARSARLSECKHIERLQKKPLFRPASL